MEERGGCRAGAEPALSQTPWRVGTRTAWSTAGTSGQESLRPAPVKGCRIAGHRGVSPKKTSGRSRSNR
jgi:hypothetical protein